MPIEVYKLWSHICQNIEVYKSYFKVDLVVCICCVLICGINSDEISDVTTFWVCGSSGMQMSRGLLYSDVTTFCWAAVVRVVMGGGLLQIRCVVGTGLLLGVIQGLLRHWLGAKESWYLTGAPSGTFHTGTRFWYT